MVSHYQADSSLSLTSAASPPSLPLVWRVRQWALIPDWAALPSASRHRWESMARLQDSCAHTGEEWTAEGGGVKTEREREREWGKRERKKREGEVELGSFTTVTAACAECYWVPVSHKQSGGGDERWRGRWRPVCGGCGCRCEWRQRGNLQRSSISPVGVASSSSSLTIRKGLNFSFFFGSLDATSQNSLSLWHGVPNQRDRGVWKHGPEVPSARTDWEDLAPAPRTVSISTVLFLFNKLWVR